MLRKLLAAGIVLLGGYIAGVYFGYRAAVVDYVENDAMVIEEVAGKMYETGETSEEQQTISIQTGDADQEGESADDGSDGRGVH